MRRLFASLTIAGLAAGLLAAPTAAGGVDTRWVDDDGRAGPGSCAGSASAFKKIQPAVDASGPGDRVLVCPGIYRGLVVIGASKDGLELRSVGQWAAVIRSPEETGLTGIVTIADGATGVVVSRFLVRHRAISSPTAGLPGCGAGAGILVEGDDALVIGNKVVADGPGTLSSCELYGGILVGEPWDEDVVTGARIRYNVLRDFASVGIGVYGEGSRMSAFRNTIRYHHLDVELAIAGDPKGGGSGIRVIDGASASVRENTVASHPSRGPLSENFGPYLYTGIEIGSSGGDTTVRGNRVYRTSTAIRHRDVEIAGASGDVTIRDNLVLSNSRGIRLYATGALVHDNRAFGNAFGLVAEDSSSGNTFVDNIADGNSQYDCLDETFDGVDVDNTWTDNFGPDDDPGFICYD